MAVLILVHGREFIFVSTETTAEGENWWLHFLANRIVINIYYLRENNKHDFVFVYRYF
jgi:hypothetical protein